VKKKKFESGLGLVGKMTDCPKCCNAAAHIIICDNDCGTFECPDCETEWHLDVTDGAALLGHHPECGNSPDQSPVVQHRNAPPDQQGHEGPEPMDLSE